MGKQVKKISLSLSHLSIYLPTYLSIYLSIIYLIIYLSIHPSNISTYLSLTFIYKSSFFGFLVSLFSYKSWGSLSYLYIIIPFYSRNDSKTTLREKCIPMWATAWVYHIICGGCSCEVCWQRQDLKQLWERTTPTVPKPGMGGRNASKQVL